MLLLRAEGCLLCFALDAVDGVFTRSGEDARPSIETVDWSDISGVGSGSPEGEAGTLVVVQTESGPMGLRAEACLGVRDVSFLESPPIPTRLIAKDGQPLCYMLLVDQQPHFLIEPRALVCAAATRKVTRPEAVGIAAITPRAATGV